MSSVPFLGIYSRREGNGNGMDLLIREEYLQKAVQLHRKYPVVDAHLDLAGEILLRNRAGEQDIIQNHYLEHWKRAGINLIVSSIYVENEVLSTGGAKAAWRNALEQITALQNDMGKTGGDVIPVRTKKELKQAVSENKTGILIYMEGLDCIGSEIGRLEELHRLGVRGASLTWSRKNALANGCCKARERKQIPGGLSEAGREAVGELERLSMFLDVSHLNDDGFEEVSNIAKKPFIATHSCARTVYDNFRNLTDGQMERLAEQGGLMGVNGCQHILGSQAGNHLEMLCRHIEYEAEKIGAAGIGFGFDLCDSYDEAELILKGKKEVLQKNDCFMDHSQVPLLTAALLQRGMPVEDVIQILGSNFIRYFEMLLPEDI